MAEKLRTVSIGNMIASADPNDVLVVYGLGSCVVICLHDPLAQVGGILHALLPTQASKNNADGHPTKFVDQGLPLLIDSMIALGATPIQMVATLCGGAQMITRPDGNDILNIGERNVRAAEKVLKARRLKIRGRATGGHSGRTIKLHVANGRATVKTLGQKQQILV